MTAKQITAQINAINRQIQAGKAANRYAAKFKVLQLQKQLNTINKLKAWDEFLTR